MFTLNDDLSIYATRGDIVFFSVSAEEDGKPYKFQAGDVVRIKVFGKKDAENVVLQKDFPVTEVTEEVEIFLSEEDTKIGEVISKPKDYWYEVELNPYDNPQTIIGYDEDGAKVFRLFPEGDDIPEWTPDPEDIRVMDDELDMTSTRPVQNQAIARAVVSLRADFDRVDNQTKNTANDLALERARIDNLATLKDGSTTGDAELIDLRVRADGSQHTNAGTAMREIDKQQSNTYSAVFANVIPHRPKFSIVGSYVNESGAIINDENSFRTGLVPCAEFKWLRYKTNLAYAYEVAFYDQDRNIMHDVSVAADSRFVEKTIDLTNIGAYYVQVSGYINDNANASTCYVLLGGTDVYEVIKEVNAVANDGLSIAQNVSAKHSLLSENSIYTINDRFEKNAAYWGTGLICAKGYRYVEYQSSVSDYSYHIAFYNENKELMPETSILGTGTVKSGVVDMDGLGVAYVGVFGYSETAPDNMWCRLFNFDTEKEVKTIKSYLGVGNDTAKMLIFGDSITETATMNDDGSNYEETSVNWPTYLAQLLPNIEIKNYAHWGAHYCDFNTTYKRQLAKKQVAMAISDSTNDDAEYIVVAFGTNDSLPTDDYETAMDVGDLAKLDTSKLYQSIRYVMWSLRQKYPNAKCFAATPIQRADIEPRKALSDAIRIMANRYNFIVIDAENESGIIRDNEVAGGVGTFLFDGLHPNTAGRKKMAELYACVIKNYATKCN